MNSDLGGWQFFFVSSSVKTIEFQRINSDLGGSAGLATFFCLK